MGFFNFFKRNISEQEFQEQQKMKYGLEKTRTGFFQNIAVPGPAAKRSRWG